MNKVQKLVLSIFLPITALFIVLDNIFPGAPLVNYIKFVTIITLFLIALRINKTYPEQRLLTAAMFLVMIGDLFLVFCKTFFDSGKFLPFGVLSFSIAYLLVVFAFQRNFKTGRFEAVAALPVLIITIPVVIILLASVSGFLKFGLLIFIAILCYCTWTCICTVSRGYFVPKSSYRIALAGFLMLICDLGVGLSSFYPQFSGTFVPLLKNIIWGSYIPAWTLIVVTIAEKNLIIFPEAEL